MLDVLETPSIASKDDIAFSPYFLMVINLSKVYFIKKLIIFKEIIKNKKRFIRRTRENSVLQG
jgi:predicted nucleotidyltransferase